MRTRIGLTALAAALALSGTVADGFARAAFRPGTEPYGVGGTYGSPSGRAPWSQPWEYDSGSDNDRRPELPYYQQGRGQQTGGPARNLLPDDNLHLFPR